MLSEDSLSGQVGSWCAGIRENQNLSFYFLQSSSVSSSFSNDLEYFDQIVFVGLKASLYRRLLAQVWGKSVVVRKTL